LAADHTVRAQPEETEEVKPPLVIKKTVYELVKRGLGVDAPKDEIIDRIQVLLERYFKSTR